MYYTVILCHKLVFLVLVRLIAILNFNRAIKIFNRIAAPLERSSKVIVVIIDCFVLL